ncbi:MAG: HD domain-containing phosphohydrolase [Thermodesulfobacteriota bacterium]
MSALKSSIVDNLDEEFYQINPDILASFPRFRPPLNLFIFKEDVAQIQLYKKTGERMDQAVQDELAALTAEGNIFVARSDHPIYAKHIAKQLDLVLVDKNLKEAEIAEVFTVALTERLGEFFEQPVQVVFDQLYRDLMVLTEYLFSDKARVKSLVRRLHRSHTLPNHAFDSAILGLWLLLRLAPKDLPRKNLDKATLALFLHDMGMCKIPAFIRDKTKPLTNDERQKVNQHPLLGAALAQKLNLRFDEITHAVMQHHERLDGSGYPQKARDADISPLGRICAVADSFAAMVSRRPYAEAKSFADAAAELAGMTSRYDPKITTHLKTAILSEEWQFAAEEGPVE